MKYYDRERRKEKRQKGGLKTDSRKKGPTVGVVEVSKWTEVRRKRIK